MCYKVVYRIHGEKEDYEVDCMWNTTPRWSLRFNKYWRNTLPLRALDLQIIYMRRDWGLSSNIYYTLIVEN